MIQEVFSNLYDSMILALRDTLFLSLEEVVLEHWLAPLELSSL